MKRVTGQELIICSPDLDVFLEILPDDGDSPAYLQPEGGGRPSSVPREAQIYTFAGPPSAAERLEIGDTGDLLYDAICQVLVFRGKVFGAPSLGAQAPAQPGAAGVPPLPLGRPGSRPPHRLPHKQKDSMVWVSAEAAMGYVRGDVVEDAKGALPVEAVTLDDVGLMRDYDKKVMRIERIKKTALTEYQAEPPAPSPPEGPEKFSIETPRGDGKPPAGGVSPTDARVLPLTFTKGGKRWRQWLDVSETIQEVAADEWPVSGPRTTTWVTNFFVRRAVGPEDHHRWWMTTCRLNNSDWGVAEHGQCCRYLEVAGAFDQLDLPNIAMIELVSRRLQTIEFQYRERIRRAESSMVFGAGVSPTVAGSVAMSAEEADLFDGAERVHLTLCCAPALVKYVTSQLKDESMIAKEARKAREEQQMVRQVQPALPVTPSAFEIAPTGLPAADAAAKAFDRKKKKGGGRGGGGGPP